MKYFIQGARPATLIVGLMPGGLTYLYAMHSQSGGQWLLFCITVAALCIQLATNFFNDIIDHEKGADRIRLGPDRLTSLALVECEVVKKWACWCLIIASVASIPLVIRGGWLILFLGLCSLYLSYGYTGGISLAYRGLGEIFVFLFFGLFAVLGSYYIYTLSYSWDVFILSVCLGCFSTVLIMVNNLRDREFDMQNRKRTVATLMPRYLYQWLLVLILLLPYFIMFFFYKKLLFSFLSFFLVLVISRHIFAKQGVALNKTLKLSGLNYLVFSLGYAGDILGGHLLL